MGSIFVRIYGGMLASMLLVGLVSYVLIIRSNSHLNTAYHEAILRGSFVIMADSFASLRDQERADWFVEMQKQFAVPIEVRSYKSMGWLGPQNQRSLVPGEARVERDFAHDQLRIMASVPSAEKLILYAEIEQFTERQIEGAMRLVLQTLLQHSPVDWELMLARFQGLFGFPVQRRSLEQIDVDALQQARLERQETVLLFRNNARNLSTVEMVVKIPGQVEYLVFGPVNLFDWLPFHLFIVCGVVAIVTMGLASYALVKPLLTRLKGLEETAVKIRRDDLSARVTVDSHDALGRLASTFNDMAEHIQRLISSQREMTNAVSHELRTPVARIRFGLEMVQDADDPELRARQIKDIDGDIQELETLIDEILTYAALEEGTPSLNLQMVDINSILTQVKKEALLISQDIEIDHKNHQADIQLVECEERYIHRVVQNLVGNALRYAKGRVRISTACEGGMCRVDVEDDGVGIPPDKWEKVFVPFARLDDSRTRASGGYGLGLSIVQRIAYWHGGVASVNSSNLGGAKFTLIWPRAQSMRNKVIEKQAEKNERFFKLQKSS